VIRRRGVGKTVVIVLALAINAAAQEYSFRFYGPAEGLQNPAVLSLAQDRQGFIWTGTEGGLYRYDGTRFRLMGQEEGLPCSTEVHGLFVASDGALWANTCNAIFRFDGRRFLPIPGVDRLLRGAQVMADGADGRMLISSSAGLYEAFRNRDASFSTRPYSLPAAFAGKPMHGILRQGSSVWFGCDRQLCMEEAGRISVFGREQGLPEAAWDGIQISKDGTVWARSPKAVYRRGPEQTRFSQEEPDLASSGFWGALTLGRDGSILVPTDQGLAIHTEGGWAVVNQQRGLRKENTVAVLEDREGTLWLGLAGGGVARWIGRGVWESWTTDQGLPGDVVWSVRRDRKGSLWIGTSLGLARIDSVGRIRTWSKKDGLSNDNVRWLAETSDGSIWAATKPGGLARIDPVSLKIHLSGSKDGLPCDPEDVFVDRHDRLWLPTMCGLFVNETPSVSNRVSRVETPESFGRFAWKVIEDKQGTIWVTNRSALWSWREGQWLEHRRPEGLLTDNPYVMALAGDGSIWMRHRYDAGVDKLEVSGDRIVRATAIVPVDPKTAEGTAFHGFDTFGNFWRGSTNGVAVLRGNNWTTFTTEDGLVSNDCDGEAFWGDKDGGVWLGTSGGLAHYRAGNGVPPSPLIADPIISRLEINQSTRLTRAEFSSLNYKAEQLVRFAYRVDQAPWTDLVERTISISGLGPGKHRLEARCRVRAGPFSAGIAAAEFRLEPRWTETWWTRLLGVTLLLGIMTQFVRWRLTAVAQKQAELEAIVAARTISLSNANHSLEDTARQLRRSEDRLKSAERLAHVGHWDWDVRANQLSWSEEMYRVFDLPPDHTPTYESFIQSVVPQDRERFERWINECLAKKSGDAIEFQITRLNGHVRIVRCTSAVSLDEEGLSKRLFGACQDITDSRRAQQEDFARQKLESLGTLASGIAHDFNNLLGGVLAQAELGLADTAPGSFPGEELTTIRRVAIRGSEIVRQLMIYAGKEAEVLGLVDVSQIVMEMLELLKVSVSKRATLISDLGPDLPAVRANASQIRQIVMNLVTNASEALGDRDGTIRVTTGRVSLDRAPAVTSGPTEDYYLQLVVSDTGRGMSPEIQAKVLDPFFSTKGAGHGLGLAIVHGIVRSLRGSIHIASEPGYGTTFQVMLPCAETAADVAPEPMFDVGKSTSPPQESIVLVVEDEDALRQPVASMLRKTGFTVLEAADGAVAIELLRVNGDKIDLILLDMTIPAASSHEVIAEAARVRPDIRVILTSAYSLETLKPPLRAPQIHGFIRKPYQLGDLLHSLRKAASA
jgi:signal transduction histidine kinase/ligand-binding sensor domain-containing protein/CheY-like chemotaxis protein